LGGGRGPPGTRVSKKKQKPKGRGLVKKGGKMKETGEQSNKKNTEEAPQKGQEKRTDKTNKNKPFGSKNVWGHASGLEKGKKICSRTNMVLETTKGEGGRNGEKKNQ